MNKNHRILLLIFSLGILHWLFFFFFVDYYSYYKIDPKKEVQISDTNLNLEISGTNLNVRDQNHLFILQNKFLKNDKDLIKNIFKEKKIKVSSTFQFLKLRANDWEKDHAFQNVIASSLRELKIPYIVTKIYDYSVVPNENFLGLPNLTLSPQILLLYFFDSKIFFNH